MWCFDRRRFGPWRDIHDGIAQELAALGYRVDALRMQAGAPGTPMRDRLDVLRDDLAAGSHDAHLDASDLWISALRGWLLPFADHAESP